MRHLRIDRLLPGTVIAFALLAAACGEEVATDTGGGSPTLSITGPSDEAQVSQPFTLTFESSVPLGATATGDHHVHVCFDADSCGAEYEVVESDTFEVTGLSQGEHSVTAELHNADHSDTGVSATITVTVLGDGGGAGEGTSPGYDYG